MIYDIKISFDYEYDAPTAWGYHLIRLKPRETAGQVLRHSRLVIEPQATHLSVGHDFFGNDRTILLQDGAHDRMRILLEATVQVMREPLALDLTPQWRQVAADASAHRGIGPDAPGHFIGPSRLVSLDEATTGLARGCVPPQGSAFAAAHAVMEAVHQLMDYVPDVTDPHTTARQAFNLGKGVCQDFAHVMIAALRGIGLPAAYASGMIRTIPPKGKPRLEGADAMHAWVDVWCGGEAGWIGFDPTNALVVGNDHVLVAIGRDYADVAPVDGVIVASTKELKHAVDMAPR